MSGQTSEKVSGKKVVGRNVAIALGIICILLAVGLVGTFVYYTRGINIGGSTSGGWENTYNDYVRTHSHSNDEYNDYVSTHSHTNAEYDSSQSNYNNYVASHHHTDSEYDNLQNQVNSLQAPKLITVNLKSDDSRPFLGTPYLHVYGEVCNVGTSIAYNSKLHVVAYQSGGVVAIDTYIVLGTIYGESWKTVDASPTYGGGALTNWSITPEWTATP